MPQFNDTVTIGVSADVTKFERDVQAATARLSSRIKPINLRINNNASQPLGKITGDISQFNKSLDAATARVLAFSANVAIINGVIQGFRSLVKETIAVEKALTDINVVLQTNQKGLNQVGDAIFDIARKTASGYLEVTEAAVEFSRQGLGLEKTLKATSASLILSRVSGLAAADSVKTLTTAINGFTKEAIDYEKIVNRLVNVDSNFAVGSKDLAESLSRVGSTASDASVSFNELLAVVTAVQQTTGRGGAVIGNALKTIFTRIGREGTIQQLKDLGVAIDESQSGIEKLRAIAVAVENVDSSTANTIKQLAGGVYQINTITAALGDLSQEYSVYDNALKIANGTTDEAIRRNEELNKTLSALASQAGTNIQELFAKIGRISFSGNLKSLFGEFNGITQAISNALDGEGIGAELGQGLLKGVGNFITGPAAIAVLGAFTKLIANVGKDAFAAFRSTAGITSEADKQKAIQGAIEQKLHANALLYEKQLVSGKGLVGIQQTILAELRQEAQLRAAIAKITPQFAASISPAFTVKGSKITPRAAEGYVPAMVQEKMAVMAGVGGASPSATPKYIPRFNDGNSVGPIVVNTSEKIIENWMGGKGSAVLNPDMIKALGGEENLSKYGKVKNVAEGYAPNLARKDFTIGGKKFSAGMDGFNDSDMPGLVDFFGPGGLDRTKMGKPISTIKAALRTYGDMYRENPFNFNGVSELSFVPADAKLQRIYEKLAKKNGIGYRMNPDNGLASVSLEDLHNKKFLQAYAGGHMPLSAEALKSFSNPKELLKYVTSSGAGQKPSKGSSRLFFDVGEGRGLKVAFNRAGIAQNEKEFPILSQDWYARQQYGDILPQGYDFDEQNGLYGFVEKLNPVGANQFKKLAGKGKRAFGWNLKDSPEESFGYQLNDFLQSYNLRNDFGGGRNIGLGKDGKLKLMDIGFDDEIAEKFYRNKQLGAFSEGFAPNLASYAIAGGKVNLKRRGSNIILDEILGGFDEGGNRKQGTGIVRQAFDLAIAEGKKFGSQNLIVDILNSKVAASMNNNSKLAPWGPFSIGKTKIPLMGLSHGYVPNLADPGFGEYLNQIDPTFTDKFARIKKLDPRLAAFIRKTTDRSGAETMKVWGNMAKKSWVQITPHSFGLDGTSFLDLNQSPAEMRAEIAKTFKSFNKVSPLADGYVPSLSSEDAIKEAATREIVSLVRQGYPMDAAKNSIKIDRDTALVGPQNPLGFGVFNTLQKQTSLKDAFLDHRGENLKTVGKANGFVPSLALDANDALALQKYELRPGGVQGIIKNIDISNINFDVVERSFQTKIRKLVEKGFDVKLSSIKGPPKESYKKLISEFLEIRGPEIAEIKAKQKQVKRELKFAATQIETPGESMTADDARLRAQKIRANTNSVPLDVDRAGDIIENARGRINSRGFLSPQTLKSILNSEQGFSELSPENKKNVTDQLRVAAKTNRRESFQRASLGIAFAGSLATPFLDSASDSLRQGGNTKSASAVAVSSGALTGASFGAILGPQGAAVGALIGGIISLGKAMDGSATKAAEFSDKLANLQAKTTETLNGFSSYIQTQQKLDTIIDEGGKVQDIAAVRQELERVFATIGDDEVRKNILATGGTVKELSKVFAESQIKLFQQQKQLESGFIAAAEKAKNTNFLGIRTESTFSGKAIGGIARSLVAGAPESQIQDFTKAIDGLNGNSSLQSFVSALETVKVSADDAASIFNDLETPLNRLLLIRELKTNLDFSKELTASTEASIKYRKSITDLNRTIGTLVAIDSSDKRTGLGIQANAFSVQQNAAQQSSALKFFNASQFAQAQLSTGFQVNQTRFSSAQERAGERIGLAERLAEIVQTNRVNLNTDPKLLSKLDKLITDGGVGDIRGLADAFIRKGTGSGDDLKTFSEIGNILNESNNRFASIDDNEKTQIEILRQTLAIQKERIQVENKINLLGGAEGQLGFATQGFDRFKNRVSNSALERQGGEVGAFGRNENALGILELQKVFGNVDGLDVRNLIPNAEQVVERSIKESLIQGFGRLNIPVTDSNINQFDSIAKLSAQKQFEKKELTALEIGQAVSSNFGYDKVAAGNQLAFSSALGGAAITEYTSSVPEIKSFLISRFGLERQRADLNASSTNTRGELTSVTTEINNLNTQINKTKANAKTTLTTPERNVTLFNSEALKAADEMDRRSAQRLTGESYQPTSILTSAKIASTQLKNLIPSNGDVDKFRKNIDKSVNGGNEFLKAALLAQFKDGFSTDSKDKRKINDDAFIKILDALEKAGGVSYDFESSATIVAAKNQIEVLKLKTAPLEEALSNLATNITAINEKIDAKNINGPTVGGNPFPRPKFDVSKLNSLVPQVDLSAGAFQRFVGEQNKPSIVPFRSEADQANALNAVNKRNNLTFGDFDRGTVDALSRARTDFAAIGGPNKELEDAIRSLKSTLLRQAQGQQFNLGKADPRLFGSIGNNTFRQNSQKLASNNAQDSFSEQVAAANEAFVSGFVTEADLLKIGIKVSQGLNDAVEAQIKLGVPLEEAQKAGKAMREKIQAELDKLGIKLPKNDFEEFGQGMAAGIGDLKKSFDDIGAVGYDTSQSLVDGFGDAFFEIISGAKSAEDAVRGMLSSIAADLSKYFLKKAILTAVTGAMGSANGGPITAANGKLLKYASGGHVPALTMGGERFFSPETVKAYGPDFFHALNAGRIEAPKYANGGMTDGIIKGGSGYRDDVFDMYPQGSFILQKAAVNKYGKDYLDSISDGAAMAQGGRVKKAFWGALLGSIFSKAITGAVVGGVTAKITGGDWKKGALYGGIAGGIAGGVGGYANAKGATGSFGSQFGESFSGGFDYLGFGKKSANGTPGSGTGGSQPGPFDQNKMDNSDLLNSGQKLLSGANGGNATGLGNQSLTASQTAVKPNPYTQAGKQLATGAILALASSLLAPKQPKVGSNIIKGNGSITTYNPDGSVIINGTAGNKTIRRSDYNSTEDLESLIIKGGGNLPTAGIPSRASGGPLAFAPSGGAITIRDRGSFQRPSNPFITAGTGSRDDVFSKLKKGEFVMNDKATRYFGTSMLNRMNGTSLNRNDSSRLRNGIVAFEKGGLVESDPSNRDRGMFSMQVDKQGGAPVQRGEVAKSAGNVFHIEINMNGAAGTEVSVKNGKTDEQNSVDGQKFANKVKALFNEFVDQEQRPGGTLSAK